MLRKNYTSTRSSFFWYNNIIVSLPVGCICISDYRVIFCRLICREKKSAIFLRTQDAGSSVLFRIIEFFLASLIPYFPFMHFSNNVVRMISPSSLNHRHLHCVPPFLFGRFYTLWPKKLFILVSYLYSWYETKINHFLAI